MNWLTRLITRREPEQPKQAHKRMVCSRCGLPIKKGHNHTIVVVQHKDCAHPRLRDPQLDLLPPSLSRMPEVSE